MVDVTGKPEIKGEIIIKALDLCFWVVITKDLSHLLIVGTNANTFICYALLTLRYVL